MDLETIDKYLIKSPSYRNGLFATVLLKYPSRHITTLEGQRIEAATGGAL